jgi:hypothetical protein
MAYTEPELPSGSFDGYIGIAAGVTKVPDQGGRYVLMAEPLDEAFRRGDSWRIETNLRMTVGELYSNSGTSKKEFLVGGGVYLDENMQPFEDGILVGRSRQINVMLYANETIDPLPATVSFVQDGVATSSAEVSLSLVGTTSSGSSIYVGPVELVTSAGAALKNKLLVDDVTVAGTGALSTTVSGSERVYGLASEVWVEVEGIFAQNDVGRDNNLLGQVLDIKKDGPLWIRYRVKGTEQRIDHLSTSLESTFDETSTIHVGFYGGPPSFVVSGSNDPFPELVVNGLYESDWDGRDNTQAERLLLEGVYALNTEVEFLQQGVAVVASALDTVPITVGAPWASNYGPLYSDLFPHNPYQYLNLDYSGYSNPARIAQSELADGTKYNQIAEDQSQVSDSNQVWERLKRQDAIMTFGGHSAPGETHFYSSLDPNHNDDFWSVFASTPEMAADPRPAFFSYAEDYASEDLRDVHFVILLGCQTGLPSNDLENNLAWLLVNRGVDIVMGTSLNTEKETAALFSQHFWAYACNTHSIQAAQVLAAQEVRILMPGEDEEHYLALDLPSYFEGSAGLKDGFLWPARYGISTN